MSKAQQIYHKYQKFDNLLRKQRQAFVLEEKNKKDSWDNHEFFTKIYDATGERMLKEFEGIKRELQEEIN